MYQIIQYLNTIGAGALFFDSMITLNADLISTDFINAEITLAYASPASGGCEALVIVCSTTNEADETTIDGCSGCEHEIFILNVLILWEVEAVETSLSRMLAH